MKAKGQVSVWVGVFVCVVAVTGVPVDTRGDPVPPATPLLIAYQGVLERDGTLVQAIGDNQITFGVSIWNAADGGANLWPGGSTSEPHQVNVFDGRFALVIGSQTGLDAALFRTPGPLFLDISVQAPGDEAPVQLQGRQRMLDAPYAVSSDYASESAEPVFHVNYGNGNEGSLVIGENNEYGLSLNTRYQNWHGDGWGRAEISNDCDSYEALMIIGNRCEGESPTASRKVRLYDDVFMQGDLDVHGDVNVDQNTAMAGDLEVGGTVRLDLVVHTCGWGYECLCPDGYRVLTGGARCPEDDAYTMWASHPNADGTGWEAICNDVSYPGHTDNPGAFYRLICAKIADN